MSHVMRALVVASLVHLVAAPSAATAGDAQAARTCLEMSRTVADVAAADAKAATDGKWAKTAVGPIFRDAVMSARAYKRVEQQCKAEQRPGETASARLNVEAAVVDNVALMVEYMGYRGVLSEIEEKRFDKQIGAPASSAGTTSPTSKGTVPSLLAFAVENGALLRTVSGTTVTFQAVPLNVVKALAAHDYIASAPNPRPGALSSVLSDLSVTVSFDTSRGAAPNTFTGDDQQISGFGARYQILNWRDPRNVHYSRAWEDLRTHEQAKLTSELGTIVTMLRAPGALPPGVAAPGPDVVAALDAWRKDTAARLDEASLDAVERVVADAGVRFKAVIEQSPVMKAQMARAGKVLSGYFVARNATIDVAKSLVLAFEYTGTKQAQTANTAAGPDLSNFKLVAGKGFRDGPEFTGNVGFTLFNSLPSTATGRVRDLQASAQLDVPLPEIQNIGKMVFSLSGLVDQLRQEPLGQPIVINGVSVTSTGTIGLFQMKLTIPTKGTGVAIPISVSLSNRSEVVLDTTKGTIARLNVGMSLDFDKLFAKP